MLKDETLIWAIFIYKINIYILNKTFMAGVMEDIYNGIWVSQYTSCPGSSSNVTLASSASN